jgi:methylated-DNA-protein-cysteine methyltransferase-like protein
MPRKPEQDRTILMRKRIMTAIRGIPRGKVSTYGAIALAAGYPQGARQVAALLRGSYGLPWQRVLGAGGEIKLEGVVFSGRRVNMKQHEHKFPRAKRKLRRD